MRFLFLLLIISSPAFALDAVVTVLETPMLKYKSLDAPVVQYLRKGDVIKVHPALNNNTRYDHMAPSPEKLAKLRKELESRDPLFKGRPTEISIDDEFIPTLDRQGNTVWVIREHILVYFGNEKESFQPVLLKDPTDYRLDEPLPKEYPLIARSGLRGQAVIGITQPYTESYPYLTDVKMKGYQTPFDLNVTFLKRRPDDKNDRFYFGGTIGVRYFKNSYRLHSGILAEEEFIRLGVGPTITYDAYKGEVNRLNIFGSLMFNPFNQVTVSQKLSGVEEQRPYRGMNFSPRLGAQYHRKQILEDIDFVLGTYMEVDTAISFRSSSAANQTSWWHSRGNDKFKTRTTFGLAGFLGFQSAY